MRRFWPYALVALLVLAAALGAVFGATGRPTAHTTGVTPAQWVSELFATTARAGTAHFTYRSVTSSPDPNVRASSSAEGVVEFRGDVRSTEVVHQVQYEIGPLGSWHPVPVTFTQRDIEVGGTTYMEMGLPGGVSDSYLRLTLSRHPSSYLGLGAAFTVPSTLEGLTNGYGAVAVRDLGRATVGGTSATRYRVTSRLFSACPPARLSPQIQQQSTDVWVDAHGRLVQARTSISTSGTLPSGTPRPAGFPDIPLGPSTMVTTLRFGDFGAPVRITAPPPGEIAHTSGHSEATIALKCSSPKKPKT